MRGLILALQLLTRLPTPTLKNFKAEWLAESVVWFAPVGLLIGLITAGAFYLGQQVDPWLGTLLAWLIWVMLTGALHLDGLADLADALGAAHKSKERFLEVLKDPHTGSFGVQALIMANGAKIILLAILTKHHPSLMGIALIPAWARWFTVAWSHTLPPLAPGSGAQIAQQWKARYMLPAILLYILSWHFAPALMLAPLCALLWWGFLRYRLGGMTGDCLGAGVEICEILLLGLLLIPH